MTPGNSSWCYMLFPQQWWSCKKYIKEICFSLKYFTEINNKISGWVYGHSLIVRLAYNAIKREKLKLLRFPYQVETVLVSTSSPSILQYICALQVLVSVGGMPPQRKVQRLMQVDIGTIFYTAVKPSASTCSHWQRTLSSRLCCAYDKTKGVSTPTNIPL